MQHQVGQAEGAGAVQGPGEAFEAGRPVGGVAEAASAADGVRRGVVLAGEAEHGAGQVEAGGAGDFGQTVALFPVGVVRVAARDLHDVEAEAVGQPPQLRARS